MTSSETIDRIRDNLAEARRYAGSQPYYVRAAIDVALLDLLQLKADLTPKVIKEPIAVAPSQPSPEPIDYRDRIVFDFQVSNISPVVKGTWVTVGHIVSLIFDGWTWSDILRSHPEMCEDDIRAAVQYASSEETATSETTDA